MPNQHDDPVIKDFHEFISKLKKKTSASRGKPDGSKYRSNKGKGSGGGFVPDSGLRFVVMLVAGLLLLTGIGQSFYTVDVSEDGVITRFGAYNRTVDPGLHFKIPFGIEQVNLVKSKIVHQEEFGFRTQSSSVRGRMYSKDILDAESLMLTGDLNVADVEWILQYRIEDPWKYLFKARNVETNIRDVSISIMRRVVGDKLVNDVLTTGRVEIADEAKELTQQVLNHYDMGVKVVRINLQDVNPPDPVKGAFNEVNAAKQEQEQTINQAEQEYNRQIPEARGRAEQTVRDAEAYAINIINRSLGDAEKFTKVYAEYAKAPSITEKRMYIETMREVFGNLQNLVIVDEETRGILPIYGDALSHMSSAKHDNIQAAIISEAEKLKQAASQ